MDAKLYTSIRIAVICLTVLALPAPLAAETAEERGDRAYRQRAEGFIEGGTPAPEPIAAAALAYEEALRREPDSLRLVFKLMEALYFQGYHATADESDQREIFQQIGLAIMLFIMVFVTFNDLNQMVFRRIAEMF